MKVLVLIYSLSAGGAERVTVNLANYWVKRGLAVDVVTLAGRATDHYQLDSRVGRIALDVDAVSEGIWQAVGGNLRRVRAIRSTLYACKPDVALGMMGSANCLLALAAMGTGIRVVGSERVHPPTVPLGPAWETLRRLVYPRLASVVAQTQESADWLRRHTGVRRVAVIPNAVEYPLPPLAPHVDPPRAEGTTAGNRLLLAVGRATPQKGFDRLIAAFAVLAPQFQSWKLAILGDGAGRSELLAQARALSLMDRVLLPGRVGNAGDWYAAADLFALTSRFEGFPNVLLEALAYGVPAVAVDCQTGPRDIVRHEVDGLLVAQNDDRALTAALARLMSDADLRHQYATRARDARERFAMDRIGRAWENLFTDLLA